MLNQDGTYSLLDRRKLLKVIDTYIEQKEYIEEELKEVQDIFCYYCIDGVRSEIVNKLSFSDNYFIHNSLVVKDKFDSLEYYSVYKKLLIIDKKKKTKLWSERNLFVLNFFHESREFLKKNNYNVERLEELCWKSLYKNISVDHALSENVNKTIYEIKYIFPSYLKNLNWSKVIMNSHLVVLLAIEYKYEFNQNQINEYFSLIKPVIEKQINTHMSLFSNALIHSSFFKSNITKWKDLKDGLGKHFKINMKEIKEYSENITVEQKFIFLLAENTTLKHDNMKNKLEKNEKNNIFGKSYLNKEEEKEYLKILSHRSVTTKVKKNKI